MQEGLELRASRIVEDLQSSQGIIDRLEAVYEQNSYAREITRHLTVNDKAYGRECIERRKKLKKDLMPERMNKLFPRNLSTERAELLNVELKHFVYAGKKRDYLLIDLRLQVIESLKMKVSMMVPVPKMSKESAELLSKLGSNPQLNGYEKFHNLANLLLNEDGRDKKVPLLLYLEERKLDSRALLLDICEGGKSASKLSESKIEVNGDLLKVKKSAQAKSVLWGDLSEECASKGSLASRYSASSCADMQDEYHYGLKVEDEDDLKEFFREAMEAGYTFIIPERLSSTRRSDMQGKTASEMNQRLNTFGLNLIGLEIKELQEMLKEIETHFPNFKAPVVAGHRESALLASYFAAVEPKISACYNSEGFYDFCSALKSSEILVDMSVPCLLKDFSMQDILALIAPRPLFLCRLKKALAREESYFMYYKSEEEYKARIDNLREVYSSYEARENLQTELD